MADIRGCTVLVHEWVTGGGLAGRALPESWAAEGLAMRRAIAGDFACMAGGPIHVIVTCDPRLPDEPGPWTTTTIEAGDDPGRLSELARAADFTVLIAPETSGILASLTRELEHAGARLLGSTAEAVEMTADKALLAARFEELSIKTPLTRTIVPGEGLPVDAVYPAVLKPVDGAGSSDTYYLADASRLPESALAMPIAILQPFVPGRPMSASFLVGRDGRSWLIAAGIQRMALNGGRFAYQGGTMPARCPFALPQLKAAVGAVAGLRGFVGVDFVCDTDRRIATILEINPRPTTSYVGLCRLLPPGLLARSWLAACEPSQDDAGMPADLAGYLEGRPHRVSFEADGACHHHEIGMAIL